MKTRIYAAPAVKGLIMSIWLFPSLFYLTFKQENLKDKLIFKLHYILNSKDQGFEQTTVESPVDSVGGGSTRECSVAL